MNNKPPFTSTKIDFKLVSRKMSIEAILAAFISFPLACLIAGIFGVPFYIKNGPSFIESPGEKLLIYGGIAVFLVSFVLFWMLFVKIFFRMTGRYEKLYLHTKGNVKGSSESAASFVAEETYAVSKDHPVMRSIGRGLGRVARVFAKKG